MISCFRYGNDNKLGTLMGVMQAIVSFVEDDGNQIRYDDGTYMYM